MTTIEDWLAFGDLDGEEGVQAAEHRDAIQRRKEAEDEDDPAFCDKPYEPAKN